ncbi:MAG: hypothetical protein QXX99_00315 [Candidatus Bathyarchaeia archaeon]
MTASIREYRDYLTLHIKTALRGGFKLLGPILLIALYVSSIVTISTLFSSYSSKLHSISGLSNLTWINVTANIIEGGAPIYAHPLIIEDKAVLILSPTNLEEWLRNHEARIKPVGNGSLILGRGLLELVKDGEMNLNGKYYGVGYILEGDMSLDFIIIVPKEIISQLPYTWEVYYEQPVNTPPITLFIEELISVGWRVLSILFQIVCLSLIISLAALVYVESVKMECYLKLLTTLNISRFKVALSLIFLALPISFTGILLGASLGVVFSHIFSFALSRVYSIPFLKPQIMIETIKLLFWLFLSAYTAVALGMVSGYAHRVKVS